MAAFDEMVTAVSEAKTTIARADYQVRQMADLVAGKLQVADVSWSTLKKLKDELRRYNPHTNRWRAPK